MELLYLNILPDSHSHLFSFDARLHVRILVRLQPLIGRWNFLRALHSLGKWLKLTNWRFWCSRPVFGRCSWGGSFGRLHADGLRLRRALDRVCTLSQLRILVSCARHAQANY